MTAPAIAPNPKARPDEHPDASRVLTVARSPVEEALRLCASQAVGLTQDEAATRLAQYGPNQIGSERPVRWYTRLLHTIRNPLVILLSVLAVISVATGDTRSAVVMALMVVLGVGLRFVQESRADAAAAALRAMIRVTATVLRNG
ncbi:MAG TPA: cation-transporting P-type ATPase, partial [Gemmatimonadaceae bacterium]|nr:cation-transporting P-type ATPase [Gemmatimonadaceae bacterium]